MAVFLSTSDEMLPILISSAVGITRIVRILAVKVIIAMISGLLIDLLIRDQRKKYRPPRAPQPYRRTGLRGTSAHLCPQTYSRSLLLYFCNFFSAESSDCSEIGEQTLAGIFTGGFLSSENLQLLLWGSLQTALLLSYLRSFICPES